MTRTEDRLTDALTAAARAVPEESLRPLIVPPARRRPVWLAPAAAALGIVLVVGLAFAVGMRFSGSRSSAGPAGGQTPVPRYYVVESLGGGAPVVRSTATGKITGTVPVSRTANRNTDVITTAARHGVYFVVASAPHVPGQRLYRFRLTSAGRVTGFTVVPGGPLGARNWAADALAASPDGSRVAVAFNFSWSGGACGSPGQRACPPLGTHPDYIDVINVATGVKSVWRGGTGPAFSVASLSWTGNGGQLAYLGQTCSRFQSSSESCGRGTRIAQVRALNPGAPGGRLDSGPVLLRQSARLPYLAQALISPDGSALTVIVLTGLVKGSQQISGMVPGNLSVRKISAVTGRTLKVLYQRPLGNTSEVNIGPDFLQLSQDSAGQHWMLNGGLCAGHCTGGFNGWLHEGRLVPLPPVSGREYNEAW